MSAKKNQVTKRPRSRTRKRSMQAVVGALGEFTDGRGRVKQCRVAGMLERGTMLTITYFNGEAGRAIKCALIAASDFRPDEHLNCAAY